MPSLKVIRKRIASTKSTQKITRAMKMVAGARLARAQARITALRPYAVKTQELVGAVVSKPSDGASGEESSHATVPDHPFLAVRPEKKVALLVLTSDRGLCGAFNANINKAAERAYRSRTESGQEVSIFTIGRKGREYLRRRNVPITHDFTGVWEQLDITKARLVARTILAPFVRGDVDSISIIYSEFKSAMSQQVVVNQLVPIKATDAEPAVESAASKEFIFEPNKSALLERLIPMYIETTILRALLDSMASELGARMTAMDSATKNAKEMIGSLTLAYNRARQAAITKELMEIIGGSEALKA